MPPRPRGSTRRQPPSVWPTLISNRVTNASAAAPSTLERIRSSPPSSADNRRLTSKCIAGSSAARPFRRADLCSAESPASSLKSCLTRSQWVSAMRGLWAKSPDLVESGGWIERLGNGWSPTAEPIPCGLATPYAIKRLLCQELRPCLPCSPFSFQSQV